MNKSLIPAIANLLGVELGERFKVCSKGCAEIDFPLFTNEYFLDEKGGLMCSNEDSFCKVNDASMLGNIILGEFEIMKLPWSPKDGDKYYTIGFTGSSIKPYITWYIWNGHVIDYTRLKLGLIYRTEKEAMVHMSEDYERLTGKKLEG